MIDSTGAHQRMLIDLKKKGVFLECKKPFLEVAAPWPGQGLPLPSSVSFIPFSHCLFCVSRLMAVGHMRHPFKADLGEI